MLPVLALFTVFVDIHFVLTKSAKKSFSPDDNWTDDKSAWVSIVIAIECSLASAAFGIPYFRSKLRSKQVADADAAAAAAGLPTSSSQCITGASSASPSPSGKV